MSDVSELSALLWALKEESTWAWKQSLEGGADHCLPSLEASWRNVEKHVIALDHSSARGDKPSSS
jgi:hypothetical protein